MIPGGALLRALLALLATWPVWRWYTGMVGTTPGAAVAPVALLAGIVLLARERRGPAPDALAAAAHLAVASLALLLPMTLAAACAILAIASVLVSWPPRGRQLPGLVLLLLALPAISHLQFYIGYPLRALTTEATAGLLTLVGLPVEAHGAVLEGARGEVVVDAPCSGVRMLWTAGVLHALVAGWARLTPLRFLGTGLLALLLVLVANALRAFALFLLETGHLPLPPSSHEPLGLAAFAVTAVAIVLLTFRAREGHPDTSGEANAGDSPGVRRAAPSKPRRVPTWAMRFGAWPGARRGGGRLAATRPRPRPDAEEHAGRAVIERRVPSRVHPVLLVASAIAALLPLFPWSSDAPLPERHAFAGWPERFEGHPLEARGLSPAEAAIHEDLIGRAQRFRAGPETVVIRWVDRPTRDLHHATSCYRFAGYAIGPRRVSRDARGRTWSRFTATKGDEVLEVRQRIEDAEGRSFLEESEWYWSAVLGTSRGPWLAWTVARPADSESAQGGR